MKDAKIMALESRTLTVLTRASSTIRRFWSAPNCARGDVRLTTSSICDKIIFIQR